MGTIIIITAIKKNNEMNVVNTRTNIRIFMVVTQEPTKEKCQLLLMSCYSCLPHILEILILKKTSSIEANVQMPKGSSEAPRMVACGHATPSVGEDVRTHKCHIFIHLSLHYSLHFIALLNLHHIIFINTFGFHFIYFPLYSF